MRHTCNRHTARIVRLARSNVLGRKASWIRPNRAPHPLSASTTLFSSLRATACSSQRVGQFPLCSFTAAAAGISQPASHRRSFSCLQASGSSPEAPTSTCDKPTRDASTSTGQQVVTAAQATQMAVYGLAQNGRPIDCNKPSDTWLREAPRGAYTTARTVGQASVFELSFHLERLASSTRLMIQSDHKEQAHAVLQQHAELVDATLLRPKLLETVRAGIAAFCSRCPGFKGELKLTVLVTWHEAGHDIFCHVAALPDRPAPPVKTQVRGAPRTNASAKDSEWVRQRRVWEADKPADVNEVLLMDGEGNILEGLSSNFFAVVDGTLQTADEGILKGTVREVALQVCKREGIPVQLKAPNMRNFNRFEGAFISSTSRLVLPIDELEAQLGGALQGEATKRSFKREGSLVQRIEQLVLAEVEACSEPLES